MIKVASEFYSRDPNVEDYWRGIVLFGRNVASYKFALAKTLIEIKPDAGELLKLSDIAPVFSRHIAAHLQISDQQTTARSSKFLDACRSFNLGETSGEKLTEIAVRDGFNNVIDAFHVVGTADVPKRFYLDERQSNGGIKITDHFSKLMETVEHHILEAETESRWRLVETAWEMKISTGLLHVEHDEFSGSLFALDLSRKRKSVTSSRSALNGYQKGRCFYCNRTTGAVGLDGDTDVDHFFPHVLKQSGLGKIIDGVWNLVLSCRSCNRGPGGKFARVPSIRLLEKLHVRNEYLIASHHPLSQTLVKQTGSTQSVRTAFLNNFHQSARTKLFHLWEAETVCEDRL